MRRRRFAVRAAAVGVAVAVVVTGGALGVSAYERAQERRAWHDDRDEALDVLVGHIEELAGLFRDGPDAGAAADTAAEAADAIREARAALLEGDAHGEDRAALAAVLEEASDVLGSLGTELDARPERMSAPTLRRLADDLRSLAADLRRSLRDAGRAGPDAGEVLAPVITGLGSLAEQAADARHRANLQRELDEWHRHREAVDRVFSRYEALRQELDDAGVSAYQIEPYSYSTPRYVSDVLEQAAEDRWRLAELLGNAASAPAPDAEEHVRRMAELVERLGDLVHDVSDITGSCDLSFETYDWVCPTIGELPQYRSFLSLTATRYAELVAEKERWATLVAGEIARLEAELA